MKNKLFHPFFYMLLVLIIDQAIKIWVKTHMYLGQEYVITDWFIIHFTENFGMAFGYEFGGNIGKLILSIFRIVAVGFITYYVLKIKKLNPPLGLVVSSGLILGGAIGNIIDSLFYGLIFSDSYGRVAEFLPQDGGYAPFLFGRVVDMFYFPLWEGYLPDWIPFWGGEYFVFFQPVFNFADASITTGIFLLIINHKKYFPYIDRAINGTPKNIDHTSEEKN
ncbi:MAG: lipoprotein signal peptidase [Vicingaceae bacterium]|jgi:signal peptidase II|nr:MAG: lipoprotein signal peptidase [Vicingaceae bacterium]